MNETDIAQQRESDISSCSNDESNGGSYEKYRRNSLPEGYTPYRETAQVHISKDTEVGWSEVNPMIVTMNRTAKQLVQMFNNGISKEHSMSFGFAQFQ